jgi:3-hydroxybutyryl-CoA dehydratase
VAAKFAPGAALPAVERVITLEQIARYAQASGDRNPIHLDPRFAAASQFGGIVAHGMLTLSYVAEMLTLAFGRDWIERGRLKVRLRAPAYPGDEVRSWGRVVGEEVAAGRRTVECAVGLKNGRGEDLISGSATVSLFQ